MEIKYHNVISVLIYAIKKQNYIMKITNLNNMEIKYHNIRKLRYKYILLYYIRKNACDKNI